VLRAYDGPPAWEPVELDPPGPGEVLVRLVACGICQTDVKVAHGYRQIALPAVLGHEGAGVVEAVGKDVGSPGVADHVVLTFASCGACPACERGAPAYCHRSDGLNFGGAAGAGSLRDASGAPLTRFFGQSALATHAVASARQAVRVPVDLPLELLGPLGCSVQTGAGAMLREMSVAAGASVGVVGVGAVGASAVMAARVASAGSIVAVDVRPERLELARELGATHTVRVPAGGDVGTLLRRAAPDGLDAILDTTGQPAVLAGVVAALAPEGTCGFVAPGGPVTLEMAPLLAGRAVRGITQGGSVPHQLIPWLAERYREGRFPFDRLVRTFPASEVGAAFAGIAGGAVIKPVAMLDGLA
jgi:aryl-alcohol dehydrogenase